MADLDGLKVSKDYHVDVPFANQTGFFLKGSNSLDWGMKSHLSRIFNPKSGNTVMFAFDHGYFMGALRTCVPPELVKSVALRVTSGSSMLQEDLSHEVVAVDIEDAVRMNADCMAVQTFIGAGGQLSSIDNLSRVINAGIRYSVPTMGVCAVGKDMARTDRFFKLATRIIAEMGVQIVKSYDCENFEEVAAACPVPIVVAGGKKLPEKEALELAYGVMQKGAHGVDMGRNIFQSAHPVAMAKAVSKIVHDGYTVKEAWELFQEESR